MIGLFVEQGFPVETLISALKEDEEYAISGKGVHDRKLYETLLLRGYYPVKFFDDSEGSRKFKLDEFIESIDEAACFSLTDWTKLVESDKSSVVANLYYKIHRQKPVKTTWYRTSGMIGVRPLK